MAIAPKFWSSKLPCIEAVSCRQGCAGCRWSVWIESQPRAQAGTPSIKSLQQAAFKEWWDCCMQLSCEVTRHVASPSACGCFKQIIEPFLCILCLLEAMLLEKELGVFALLF